MKCFPLAALIVAIAPLSAVAQQPDLPRMQLAATIGQTEYDFSDVGTATVFGGRAGFWLNRLVGIEAQLGRASLDPNAGNAALYFPEAQLQLRWPVWRVTPYLGAGAGAIIADSRDPQIATESEISFSASGGIGAELASRVMVIAEARLRGAGTRFTGSTGDLNVGLGYRF